MLLHLWEGQNTVRRNSKYNWRKRNSETCKNQHKRRDLLITDMKVTKQHKYIYEYYIYSIFAHINIVYILPPKNCRSAFSEIVRNRKYIVYFQFSCPLNLFQCWVMCWQNVGLLLMNSKQLEVNVSANRIRRPQRCRQGSTVFTLLPKCLWENKVFLWGDLYSFMATKTDILNQNQDVFRILTNWFWRLLKSSTQTNVKQQLKESSGDRLRSTC